MSIQTNFPAIKPTLLLDFANTEQLDPRITFTRASTATYYGAQTAKAEENLLLQSQTFNNAVWVKSSAIVTPERTTAPDNSFTASAVLATGANGTLLQTFTANAVPYTFSVWLLRFTGTGNVDITVDGTTFSTVVPTSSWVRFSVTTTPSAGSRTAGVRLPISGDEFFIWGAQLEQRSSVTAYTPTTTQPITNYIPRLLTAASGVARFDHNPTTFESLGLEIEESRTNLVTYSEMFADAVWSKTNSTITANTIVAPDGTLTGDKIFSNFGSLGFTSQSLSQTSGTSYALSVLAKAGEYSFCQLRINTSVSSITRAYFNLSNGTTTGATNCTASITPVGNGWYRCSIVYAATVTTASGGQRIYGQVDAADTVGDGYSGIYIWGAQLEAGAFATSYIPTVASQVTRAADAASMTGTNFSSWYNAGQGTLYSEASTYDASVVRVAISLNDGTTPNRILTTHGAAPKGFVAVSGVTQMSQGISSVAFTNNTFSKMSVAYADNNGNAAANGTLGTLDTAMTIPAVTQLQLGTQVGALTQTLNGTIKKLAYYPLRVTDTQLQALTS